ncbi:hypothetical protein [Halomonas sp. 3H]|uniref:hypothetical protein n=1 Tax=Halomonas sp. 3H TaxID=2952527 RepID=UPI0020B70505|nr:hypothetical protein [Halomonas sp. 3H]
MKRCPHCASHGIYKNRRSLWRRLVRLPHSYRCIDCGTSFSRRALLAAESAREGGHAEPDPESAEKARRKSLPVPAGLKRLRPFGLALAHHAHDVAGLPGRCALAVKGCLQRAGLMPIPVWVVKQVDGDILHLCGSGTLYHPRQRSWRVLNALRQHRYQGGVRLGSTGIVLNSRLFAALIPLDELTLKGPTRGRWQGREWRIARVPQHRWQYEGRLMVQAGANDEGEPLISSEDVSRIRDQVDPQATPPGMAIFQPGSGRTGSHSIRGPIRRRDS